MHISNPPYGFTRSGLIASSWHHNPSCILDERRTDLFKEIDILSNKMIGADFTYIIINDALTFGCLFIAINTVNFVLCE